MKSFIQAHQEHKAQIEDLRAKLNALKQAYWSVIVADLIESIMGEAPFDSKESTYSYLETMVSKSKYVDDMDFARIIAACSCVHEAESAEPDYKSQAIYRLTTDIKRVIERDDLWDELLVDVSDAQE